MNFLSQEIFNRNVLSTDTLKTHTQDILTRNTVQVKSHDIFFGPVVKMH